MTTAHTPTPWALRDEYEGTIPIDAWDGEQSVEVCRVSADDENQLCNAAFIVRACNAHDDLLAALDALNQSLIPVGSALGATGKDVWPEIAEAIIKARAAILKAKVKP